MLKESKSGKPPAFMFYPRDFLLDPHVVDQTPAQVGAYICLLCHAWLSDTPGVLVDDDVFLAKRAGMTLDEWEVNRESIVCCFHRNGDGLLIQKRMVKEREAQKKRHAKAAKAARKRWDDER